jgi:hypothetical protein
MKTDYSRRCVIPMIPIQEGLKPFEIIVYGRSTEELMTLPNDVIGSIASRHPGYTSTPFHLYDL